MDKIVSISEAQKKLPRLVSILNKKASLRYMIGLDKKSSAVLLSLQELETLEVLASRKTMNSLYRAQEDERASRLVRYRDIFK